MKTQMKLSEAIRRKGDGSTYHHCPRCGGNGKLEVTPSGDVFYCHKCKWGGRMQEARQVVTEMRQVNTRLWEGLRPVPMGVRQWEYLRKRGFTTEEIVDLHPMEGPLHLRVYLPVLNDQRKPIFALARLIADLPNVPRYLVPPAGAFKTGLGTDIRKSDIFWGLHRLPVTQKRGIVICEGILSAVKCHPGNGTAMGIALLGKTMSKRQAEQIVKYISPKEVTFCFDGDAHNDALKAIKLFSTHYGGPIYNIRLPADNDPANIPELHRWFERRERLA